MAHFAKFLWITNMPYVWSTIAVAAAVLIGYALRSLAPLPNVSLIFLLAVLFPAVSFGMWPAIYASFLSFLAYNFFFIHPIYTLTVAEPHELLALVIFLIVAIITSALAGRVRDQAREMVRARTAAETERVRNTLLAAISHDFRTPLSSILGAATSLLDYRDKLGASAQADLLGQIKQEAEGLDEMVRNLLAITRIDAGGLELNYDWVDLREVVQRVINAARRRGAAQRITAALPGDLPMVRADAMLAEQALGNVVNNAVLHTPMETTITVDAVVDPASVSLRVTDDGPGIPAETLPHAFDKFVRVRRAGTAGREGTGLGLAIARGIVEAHRGSTVAQSPVADGRGTRVVLTFPREETSP